VTRSCQWSLSPLQSAGRYGAKRSLSTCRRSPSVQNPAASCRKGSRHKRNRDDARSDIRGTSRRSLPRALAGTKQPDGTILALKIALLPPAPPAAVKGAISSLGAGFFLLGDVKVLVSEKTVIRSKDTILKFADLKVGDRVTAYGSKAADGSFQADTVEVMTASSDPPYSSVRGAIVSVAADSFVVAGVTVKVNDKTAIAAGGQQIHLKDLKAGDWVEVAGTKQIDGSLLAIKVAVLPPTTSNVSTVEGVIESLGADYLVVKGMKILVTEKTVIREGDKALKFSDLKAGLTVAVGFSKQGDVLTALKIQLRAPSTKP